MTGSGKAVVCAVGKYTLKEAELCKDDLKIGDEQTPLMEKLTLFGSMIGKWA